MKKLIVIILLLGKIGSAQAEIVLDAGNTKYIFSDADKDSEMVKSFTRIAEIEKAAYEKAKKREQLKDELGFGPLERYLVSGTHLNIDKIKYYRGANTDPLFALLKNEDFAAYWPETAKAIALIGDEKDAERLANFATAPFTTESEIVDRHIAAREGALWGLQLAWVDQGIPWVRDFLVAHASPSQWIDHFDDTKLDPNIANKLAQKTLGIIGQMGNDKSLKMLKEIREQHISKAPIQPFRDSSSEPKTDELLEHINMRIEQSEAIAEARAKQSK